MRNHKLEAEYFNLIPPELRRVRSGTEIIIKAFWKTSRTTEEEIFRTSIENVHPHKMHCVLNLNLKKVFQHNVLHLIYYRKTRRFVLAVNNSKGSVDVEVSFLPNYF